MEGPVLTVSERGTGLKSVRGDSEEELIRSCKPEDTVTNVTG